MATAPIPHSPVLRRLADDLGADTVESRLTPAGELIAELHAIGHKFRFRLQQSGAIVERDCQADQPGLLTQGEMHVLWELAHAELARREHGHLRTNRHGSDVFAILGRAELKLSLALADQLGRLERSIVSVALDQWGAHVASHGTPELAAEVREIIAAIQRKLAL